MTGIFETQDGTQYPKDDIKRKEKCDFCGKLGDVPDEDGFFDGQLPSLNAESYKGDRADVCRECLTNGLKKEKLDEVIGSKKQLEEEINKESVELS